MRTLLIITQMYLPDPGAVGQYEADVAEEMVRRGWRVIVYTANRGYDNPDDHYASREVISGVEIRRFPFSSFGKSSIAVRLLGGLLFVGQSIVRALLARRIDALLISTVPPVSALAGIALSALRRTPVVYWIMDLNPDQFVALGHASGDSLLVRTFDAMNRAILRAARHVVVLDRYMAERVLAKRDVRVKLSVIPPWSRDDHLAAVPHSTNPFRRQHALDGKFVVMYSGNHGPSNPIATLLAAARAMRDDPRLAFVFIGGGIGKVEVDEAARDCQNILSLPYQPMSQLSFSLSAADVHAVTMGENVVGIVHPSKVYGAFAVERPILFIGPERSHIGDILGEHRVGWRADHGDVASLVQTLQGLVDLPTESLVEAGARAQSATVSDFGSARLCSKFSDILEAC